MEILARPNARLNTGHQEIEMTGRGTPAINLCVSSPYTHQPKSRRSIYEESE